MDNVLDTFHPLVAEWFRDQVGTPTDIQVAAWRHIAAGEHLLACAPTGSGKTLAAFLTAIDRLIRGQPGRILYISPLKALNNDVQRNLRSPLAQIAQLFAARGVSFPEIDVAVRSGDTEAAERRRIAKRLPEIFITTPESLNVMLSSKGGVASLAGFGTVILDEIHAVASNKRGTYLITAIERLVALYGELQRIAISATVDPIELVAEFVGGYSSTAHGDDYHYRQRPVAIARSAEHKHYDIQVNYPQLSDALLSEADRGPAEDRPPAGRSDRNGADADQRERWWSAIVAQLRQRIARNRSTLIFANSRRMVEKITRLINEAAGTELVYSHHGSLSKEIRHDVEARLKSGELAAIVATASLELGIDIGSVDEVVLLQSPFSIASAIQRIGRAGHQVGKPSRATVLPIYPRDLIESAVIAAGVEAGAVEPIAIPQQPLDVLAQVILSMTIVQARDLDQMYSEVRGAAPYQELERSHFDLVIEMLAGRYADSRVRDLRPRLLVDRTANSAVAHKSVPMLIYRSGGVIPDRGYFTLRTADGKTKIGELDEEFVWERQLGESFPFGNQIWRIERITHNDVEVTPAQRANTIIPFWIAANPNRPFHYAGRVAEFLEAAETVVATPRDHALRRSFTQTLRQDHRMTDGAIDALLTYLADQREATGTALPHRHHLVVEHYRDPTNTADTHQTVIHTLWGSAVNKPLAYAWAAVWEQHFGRTLESFVTNDAILINVPHEIDAKTLFGLVQVEQIPQLLRATIESTGLFGAHFRENAQRSLLLPRKTFGDRMPLWVNRIRSKTLLEATASYPDFPVLLETWRECMQEEFDLPTLALLLDEVANGTIAIDEVQTDTPSPFCDGVVYSQVEVLMYRDDAPDSRLRSSLGDELLAQIIDTPHLRPMLGSDLVETFRRKVQRTAEGYAPTSPPELLAWIAERIAIPADQWDELLDAIERDSGAAAAAIVDPIADKIRFVAVAGDKPSVVALERSEQIERVLGSAALPAASDESDPDQARAELLAEWLQFHGPVTRGYLRRALPVDGVALDDALDRLAHAGQIVVGQLLADPEAADGQLCDRRNLESLLRMRRAAERPTIEPLEADQLQLYLAQFQGLTTRGQDAEALTDRLDTLLGYPLRAAQLETDLLPARLAPYYPAWLDAVLAESDLLWLGSGKERCMLAFEDDVDVYAPDRATQFDPDELVLLDYFGQARGRHAFLDIAAAVSLSSQAAAEALWSLAWKGVITNDGIEALRKGVLAKFKAQPIQNPPGAAQRYRRGGRAGRSRWKSSRPIAGSWYLPRETEPPQYDAIERNEIAKERVRQLLARYGVLFRELLKYEAPALRWSAVFRTLRLMELSGELVTGHFVRGVRGLQFAAPSGVRALTAALATDAVYWISATDPASLCGIEIESLKGQLPPRVPTTHLVYHGARLVLVSRKRGTELTFNVAPQDPAVPRYLALFSDLLGRQFDPPVAIKVEQINDVPAVDSPYAGPLGEFGFEPEYHKLTLRRRYG